MFFLDVEITSVHTFKTFASFFKDASNLRFSPEFLLFLIVRKQADGMMPISILLNARDGKQDFQHHAHKKLNRLKKKTLTNWHCILQSICGLGMKKYIAALH